MGPLQKASQQDPCRACTTSQLSRRPGGALSLSLEGRRRQQASPQEGGREEAQRTEQAGHSQTYQSKETYEPTTPAPSF